MVQLNSWVVVYLVRNSWFEFYPCRFSKDKTKTIPFSWNKSLSRLDLRIVDYLLEVVYVTIENPAFCLALSLAGVHFQDKFQHIWSRGWAKTQLLTNQNSRNSWCQIVRGTICLTKSNTSKHVNCYENLYPI